MDSSEKKINLKEVLKADNVATLLSDDHLEKISQQVLLDYNNDKVSYASRLKKLQELIKLAKMTNETKSYPWEGASNVIYPLIANAGIEYGATLYPEIIKDSEVVKCKVNGSDDGKPVMTENGPAINPETGEQVLTDIGSKRKMGNRVSSFMNYQLLEEMTNWETDVDKLGNAQPIVGNMYKRIYWDTASNKPCSELIFPDKLVINSGARDIDSAIATHIIELYPHEIQSRVRSGFYKECDLKEDGDLVEDNEQNSDDLEDRSTFNTKLHNFLDQFTYLDLDEDEFPEPYIVTIHEISGKVVRIVPRFSTQDIKKNQEGEVKEIKAQKELVKYGFIPSPDGSFYDVSFGDLLYNLNLSINSTLNQLFDAGHLSITGGGFIGKGMKVRGGRISLSPGEWKMVDVMGEDLARNIVPIPQPKPDPTLFALLGYLVEAGKNMSLLRDVLSGEAAGNIQATTYISMVEQGLKQFKSIYKRFRKSLKEELKLIYNLNAKYLSNKKYAEVLDDVENNVDVKLDFDDKDYSICPVADVSAITSHQRMAQANYLMQFMGNPYINQEELLKQVMEISQVDNIEKLVVAPPPPQNPMMEVEQLKAQVKMQEMQMKSQENMQKMAMDFEKMKAEIEKLRTAAMVDMANVAKTGQSIEDADQEREIKVMDNIVDQQTKQIEVAGRLTEAKIKQETEALKLENQRRKLEQTTEPKIEN